VTVTPGRVASVSVDGRSFTVVVDRDTRSRLGEASDSYGTTVEEMQTAAGNLNGSVEDGNATELEAQLSEVNQTRALNQDYTRIQGILFAANATGALDAYEKRHTESLAEVRGNLTDANQSLAQQTQGAATSVLGNLLAVLLVGAVLGGVGGRFATNRILSSVEAERRRSSAVDFRPKHLAVQLAVALVLVGGAVALAAVLGLFDPLIIAVEAVIPV
jgi:cell division protein ZapA (FtsZ GTPase activity inhibitor)